MAPPSQDVEPPANPGRFNAITTLRLRMAALELGLQQLNQVLPSSDGDTPEEDA